MFDTALVTSGKGQSYKNLSKGSTDAFQTQKKTVELFDKLGTSKNSNKLKWLHEGLVCQAYLSRIVLGKATKHIHC